MSEQDNVTPMMRHYLEVKQSLPGYLVLYRLGDFFELFFDDAKVASSVLNLTLTRRGTTSNGEPIPMAGMPYHASENYISRLVKAGYSIALCDQVGEKVQGKSMERKVTRLITPGTVIEDNMLPERQDNLIVSIYQDRSIYGLSTLNLSSGQFTTTEVETFPELQLLVDKIDPAELIYPEGFAEQAFVENCRCAKARPVWAFDYNTCFTDLCVQFKTSSLVSYGIEEMPCAICAAGALLEYVKSTQNVSLEHITRIVRYQSSSVVIIDKCAQKNLELVSNLSGEIYGSLLSVIDETSTPMGSRQLRNMLLNPLRDNDEINQRLDLVEAFMCFNQLDELSDVLNSIGDIERIVARIGLQSAKPRDLAKLRDSLALIPSIRYLVQGPNAGATDTSVCVSDTSDTSDSSDTAEPTGPVALPDNGGVLTLKQAQAILLKFVAQLPQVDDLVDLLQRGIKDFPALLLRDGGVIADGFNATLDDLRDLQNGAEATLKAIEDRERARTGITTLRVNYNNIHGYYIEISKAAAQNAPLDYVRRQTLKNSERFITPELKELEERTMVAQARSLQLEKELFDQIQTTLIDRLSDLSKTVQQLALMDTAVGLSRIAQKMHYVRPKLACDSYFKIENGRHPVVESLSNSPFISNGIELSNQTSLVVISGPNMGGKSTFMRQTALIAIMARMGSFVPASDAIIGDIDRIFTRIGASDDLASGRSTFMVEMEETATILNNATFRSLVIMDEVGRGTSGLEGAAIAEAIVQHFAKNLPAKVMFATHYTEVTNLVENYPNAQNLCFNAKEYQGRIVFLYHAQPGRQSRSFGIEVAQLAGIPDSITRQAILFFQARTQEMNQVNQFSPSLFASVEMLESMKTDPSAPDQQITENYEQQIKELKEKLAELQQQVKAEQAKQHQVQAMAEAGAAGAAAASTGTDAAAAPQLNAQEQSVLSKLRECDCNSLTPLMALTLLTELQGQLK